MDSQSLISSDSPLEARDAMGLESLAPADLALTENGRTRKILLISNEVMHYRVSVYNYFNRRFREYGFEFAVLTDRLQEQNQKAPQFEAREIPFDFLAYRRAINAANPAAVILFLHLKDLIIWPHIHWL